MGKEKLNEACKADIIRHLDTITVSASYIRDLTLAIISELGKVEAPDLVNTVKAIRLAGYIITSLNDVKKDLGTLNKVAGTNVITGGENDDQA